MKKSEEKINWDDLNDETVKLAGFVDLFQNWDASKREICLRVLRCLHKVMAKSE